MRFALKIGTKVDLLGSARQGWTETETGTQTETETEIATEVNCTEAEMNWAPANSRAHSPAYRRNVCVLLPGLAQIIRGVSSKAF